MTAYGTGAQFTLKQKAGIVIAFILMSSVPVGMFLWSVMVP